MICFTWTTSSRHRMQQHSSWVVSWSVCVVKHFNVDTICVSALSSIRSWSLILSSSWVEPPGPTSARELWVSLSLNTPQTVPEHTRVMFRSAHVFSLLISGHKVWIYRLLYGMMLIFYLFSFKTLWVQSLISWRSKVVLQHLQVFPPTCRGSTLKPSNFLSL